MSRRGGRPTGTRRSARTGRGGVRGARAGFAGGPPTVPDAPPTVPDAPPTVPDAPRRAAARGCPSVSVTPGEEAER